MIDQFKQDVDEGLSEKNKSLPSHYFYDAVGDELFRQIMALPEYYLTRAENEIFDTKTQQLIDALNVNKDNHFEIIELGPGDAKKSKKLLKELINQEYQLTYHPVDISQNALDHLQEILNDEIRALNIKPRQGHYFDALSYLKNSDHKKVVLFLGSSIGNLDDELATEFLYQLGSNFRHGDILILGVDLKKSSDIVLPAYNDAKGVTARFNLNLLRRINRELRGNFDIENFDHQPEYHEQEGVAYSYLISLTDQCVYIGSLDKSFGFAEGEKIHTEISRKYNEETLGKILSTTNFIIESKITDSKNYFSDFILKRN